MISLTVVLVLLNNALLITIYLKAHYYRHMTIVVIPRTSNTLQLSKSLKRENQGVRTKHEPGVHGPPLWTGSMDPLSWTRSMDSFFYFYKKVLHQVHGHSKTEMVPKKDLTRRCRPMLTIDHKYLVVLTWHTLCLHMCSRKTVKLSWFKSYHQERNYALQYKDSHHP